MRRVHKLAGTEWRAGDSWTEDSLMPASSCNGCMPVRAVCKPHSPDLKKRRSSD